jgi:hypothetical protein
MEGTEQPTAPYLDAPAAGVPQDIHGIDLNGMTDRSSQNACRDAARR